MEKDFLHFEEESRLVPSTASEVTPCEAAMAGYACGKSAGGEGASLIAAHSGEKGAAALCAAFAAGAAASGADCICADACPATAAAYAAGQLGCTMGCHIHTEITASLKLFASDGLPLYGSLEDKICSYLGMTGGIPYSHYGRVSYFGDAGQLYAAHIAGMLPHHIDGIFADVNSSSQAVLDCCGRILDRKNDRSGKRIAFHISSDGSRISAYTDETGYVFREKLLLMCQKDLFERGLDSAVCGRPLKASEKLAASYGRKIFTCEKNICVSHSSPSEQCLNARRLASQQLFTFDGIALMAKVLEILSRKGTSLSEELSDLPSYAGLSRYIPADRPSELLERLCSDGSGLLSDSESGRVIIRPVRTGKGLMLNVESYAAETAGELCDFYTKVISAGRN